MSEISRSEVAIVVVCAVAFGVLIRDVAQDYRDIKAEKLAPVKSYMDAPIWSKKCMREGKTVYATQADGEKWIITCVGGRGQFV